MQVILLEKINHLGELGAVVKVKDGYARNLAFVPPVMEAIAAASEPEQWLALEWIGHLTDKWVSAAGRLATETAKELEAQPLEVLA